MWQVPAVYVDAGIVGRLVGKLIAFGGYCRILAAFAERERPQLAVRKRDLVQFVVFRALHVSRSHQPVVVGRPCDPIWPARVESELVRYPAWQGDRIESETTGAQGAHISQLAATARKSWRNFFLTFLAVRNRCDLQRT